MVQVGFNPLQNNCDLIKILLADDSEIVRRGIRQLLAAQSEIQIVGEAVDFAQTIRMTTDLNPQVVVLDLHMPDENNIAPEEIKSRLSHGSRVLAISIWNDEENKELAASLGAAILLDKMNLATTLVPAIIDLQRLA
ncbi:MAG TPA: response regulator transcription factor [Candidatus Acidoferrum sp.]|jgi:DNA-binding NarL/FixJ family response regulator